MIAKSLQAEFIKLKYPPIIWLTGIVILVVLAVIFASHILDANAIATLGANPWQKLIVASNGIFFIFMAIPFTVLLVGAALFMEHDAEAWKYQYVVPIPRVSILLLKLMSLLIWFIMAIMILIIGLTICGYLLDYCRPEMEFAYNPFHISRLVEAFTHSFLAILGVIGIQFFLGFRFKGFLLPVSLGIIGFVVGVILGSLNNPLARFYPYSYPLIVKDAGMFRTDKIGITAHGWFNSIELASIAIFVFFVLLTLFLERRKNIV